METEARAEAARHLEVCRAAFSRVATDVPVDTIQESEQFAKRADEIFARLKISSFGLDADVFFGSR